MSTTRNGTHSKRDPGATAEKFSRLYERPLPFSLEAEMGLLGSLILSPAILGDVSAILTGGVEAFHEERHGAIYQALIDAYDRSPDADLVEISQILRDRGHGGVCGAEYLQKLVDECPSPVGGIRYAKLVADRHTRRLIIDACDRVILETMSATGQDAAPELLDLAESAIMAIAGAHGSSSAPPSSLGELLDAELARLRNSDGTGQHGVRTGFYDLDRTLAGLHPGEMTVIAARPSMGKTALMLNIAEQIARGGAMPDQQPGEPVPVGIFSLEMSKAQLSQRMLSAFAQVDSTKIRAGTLSRDELAQVERLSPVLGALPILIDDSSNLNLLTLRSAARRMVQKHGARVVFIDYLQLLTAPDTSKRDNRQVEVSAISRGVKALAKELGVPVVVLSQLNRASEQRQGNRPRMSDLRESGSIEQDADVVLLLHREDYYHRDDQAWRDANADKINTAELIVEKQRNGPTGVAWLHWDPRTTRFRNHAQGQGAPASQGSLIDDGRHW